MTEITFFRFCINRTNIRRKFQCSLKEYGIQTRIPTNGNSEYTFSCVKSPSCQRYWLAVVTHPTTANLSRPRAGKADFGQGWLRWCWVLQSRGSFGDAYLADPTEVLPTGISALGLGYTTLGFSIWSFSYIRSSPAANREVSVKGVLPAVLPAPVGTRPARKHLTRRLHEALKAGGCSPRPKPNPTETKNYPPNCMRKKNKT